MKVQCVECNETEGTLTQMRRLNGVEEFILCARCQCKIIPSKVQIVAVWQGHSWGAEMVR